MSSPVAHSLVGLNLHFLWTPYKRWGQLWEQKWEILTAIALVNLPDVDMLVGWWFYGDRHVAHRTLTHSPFFAILLALVLTVVRQFTLFLFHKPVLSLSKGPGFFEKPSFWNWVLRYFTLIFSHGVMDFFCGDVMGFQSGQGVAMLYPWDTRKYTSPVALLPAVDLNLGIGDITNWKVVIFEATLFGSFLLLLTLFRRKTLRS